MAFLTKARPQSVPLTAQLTASGEALRTRAEQAAEAADSYRALADDAAIKNSVATKQALAVEQALSIVSAAGVTL